LSARFGLRYQQGRRDDIELKACEAGVQKGPDFSGPFTAT